MADVFLDIIGRTGKFAVELKNNRVQLKQLGEDSEKVNRKMQGHFDESGKTVNKLTSYLIGMFTIGAAVHFLKKIIEVRSEWEKQVAVLKTLTGSQREAEKTMKMLNRVADASPAKIGEISDAYIRLLNQGIKPTEKQMMNMMDVAVSQGRSLGQLAEAIFDATNGSTRGLRDLNIVSKIEGNKIQLSFRGITKEVDNTAKAISDFVIEAGQMKGVAGASAEVMQKLPGAIKGIGDAWEGLLITLGEQSTGVFITAAHTLTRLIDNLKGIYSLGPGSMMKSRLDAFTEEIKDFDKVAKLLAIDSFLKELQRDFDEFNEGGLFSDVKNKQNIKYIELLIEETKRYKQEVEAGTDTGNANANAVKDLNTEIENLIHTIPGLSDKELPKASNKLKDLLKDFKELTGAEYEQVGVTGLIKSAIEALSMSLGSLSEDDRWKVIRRISDLNEQLKRLSEFKEPELKKISHDSIVKPLEMPGPEYEKAKDAWLGLITVFKDKNISASEEETEKRASIIKKFNKDSYENSVGYFKLLAKWRDEQDRIDKEADEEKRAKKQALYTAFANTAMAITDLIAAKNQNAMDHELATLEDKHNKKLISDENYEKQSDAIRKKYAKKGQTIAVSQALISGALAVMDITSKWAAEPPVMYSLIALQAIMTALQVATIKAQKFSKGVLDLKGSGNKDTIPAWLAPHETVMTAKETRDYMPYLKAMKEGVFPRFDLELAKQFEKNTYNNLNYDNSKEISKLEQIRIALNKRPSEIELLQGSQRIVKKGNVTTRFNLN